MIKDANVRYSNFILHVRKVGDTQFSEFPASTKSTADGGVEAFSLVHIPRPIPNQEYESYFSYRLDGKEVKEKSRVSALISQK
ncbi:MAG: hypothetical protein ABI615_01540 [Chthoniobacterales bacterium]